VVWLGRGGGGQVEGSLGNLSPCHWGVLQDGRSRNQK